MDTRNLSVAIFALSLLTPIAGSADGITLYVELTNDLSGPVHFELDGKYSCDRLGHKGENDYRCYFTPYCKQYFSHTLSAQDKIYSICVQSAIAAGSHKVVATWPGHRIEQNIKTYSYPANQYGPASHVASCTLELDSNGQDGTFECNSGDGGKPDP